VIGVRLDHADVLPEVVVPVGNPAAEAVNERIVGQGDVFLDDRSFAAGEFVLRDRAVLGTRHRRNRAVKDPAGRDERRAWSGEGFVVDAKHRPHRVVRFQVRRAVEGIDGDVDPFVAGIDDLGPLLARVLADAVDRRQPIAEQFVCPDVGFGLDLAAGVLLVDRPAATDQPLSDLGR